jgi:hypothetical protein
LFNFNPIEVYNKLIQAYDVRSTFVHGGTIEPEVKKGLQKMARTTAEYARVSLLVFFTLKGQVEKEKLISTVDHSLFDAKAAEKLKSWLSSTEWRQTMSAEWVSP